MSPTHTPDEMRDTINKTIKKAREHGTDIKTDMAVMALSAILYQKTQDEADFHLMCNVIGAVLYNHLAAKQDEVELTKSVIDSLTNGDKTWLN